MSKQKKSHGFYSGLVVGILAAIAVVGTANMAQAGVSPAVGKALKEAYAHAKRRNASGADAAIARARAAAKTSEERRTISKYQLAVYSETGRLGKAAGMLEKQGANALTLAKYYFSARNYNKAIHHGKRAGGKGQAIAAQAYMRLGNYRAAKAIYERLLRSHPRNSAYIRNLANTQYKLNDREGYMKTLTKLIVVSPNSSQNWRAVLNNLQKEAMPEPAKMAIYILRLKTKSFDKKDIVIASKTGVMVSTPGFSKQFMSMQGAPSDARGQRLKKRIDRDANSAVVRASKLTKGTSLADKLTAGKIYTSVGKYPQAISALSKAATSKNYADEAYLYLGLTQVLMKQPKKAKVSFAKVNPNSNFNSVAGLWKLYASTRR